MSQVSLPPSLIPRLDDSHIKTYKIMRKTRADPMDCSVAALCEPTPTTPEDPVNGTTPCAGLACSDSSPRLSEPCLSASISGSADTNPKAETSCEDPDTTRPGVVEVANPSDDQDIIVITTSSEEESADLDTMNLADLKNHCKSLGLSHQGMRKAQVLAMLKERKSPATGAR